MQSIPVIDIFAGPGGLSEGLSRFGERDWSRVLSTPLENISKDAKPQASPNFRIALSIEMDEFAHRTLRLRSFVRLLRASGKSTEYYQSLVHGEEALARLYERYPVEFAEAQRHCWKAELGKDSADEVDFRIRAALGGAEKWVLIGGPPCQAYSLVGRARNSGNKDYVPKEDHRHYLYREYLRIVATHRPIVFVMENVKGLLSSRVDGDRIFTRILSDLETPAPGLKYRLVPVVSQDDCGDASSADATGNSFIVRAEEYGVPQARHRVILIGIRSDHGGTIAPLVRRTQVATAAVLRAPNVHAGVSNGGSWKLAVQKALGSEWLRETDVAVRQRIESAIGGLSVPQKARGGEYIAGRWEPDYARAWYCVDEQLGFLNHSTRSHIEADLHRYLFCASYAKVHSASPTLREFPPALLPKHENASASANGRGGFADRFRVQLSSKPSTTVTSHISKDGHYYIHYAPEQCRSLTVREAARLQTFPDDYFFCGPRTEQYHQVGNAVPPLLAVQIAERVAAILRS